MPWKMVIGASIYPGIIGGMAISVTVFLLIFVLPRFAGVFKGKEDLLPWPTTFLMNASSWMVSYWWMLLLAAIAVVVSFMVFIRTDIGSLWFDKAKLVTPLFKRMFRAVWLQAPHFVFMR